jgi:hypothetical protein
MKHQIHAKDVVVNFIREYTVVPFGMQHFRNAGHISHLPQELVAITD